MALFKRGEVEHVSSAASLKSKRLAELEALRLKLRKRLDMNGAGRVKQEHRREALLRVEMERAALLEEKGGQQQEALTECLH